MPATITHTKPGACALAMLTALLVGCSAPAGPFDDVRHWRGDADTVLRHGGAALRDGSERPRVHDDPAPLAAADAEDYVALALQRHPMIRAARHKVSRLHERIEQARTLDDPMLEVMPVGEMAETAAGEVGLMTSLSQRVPWPGKLDARGKLTAQEAAVAAAELARVQQEVAADARRAYWGWYMAHRAIDATRRSRDLVLQMHDIAEGRLRAGLAPQQELLRLATELADADRELIALEQQRLTAAAMLNTLIDRAPQAALPEPGPVELPRASLQLDSLLTDAARENPELVAGRQMLESYRQQLRLARLDRWPDPTFSVSYNVVEDEGLSPVADGTDQWWFGVGINIPLWQGRRDAAEREALHGVYETLAELHATHNRVTLRVQDSFNRVMSQQRLAELLRDRVLPQARQATAATLNDYRAGTAAVADLLDSRRAELSYELAYQQALADLEQARADLRQAVGEPAASGGEPRHGGR